tara:strand:- start:1400 stop:1648 length:249 start_codon:yes stop_codon:yes gene_type:complete
VHERVGVTQGGGEQVRQLGVTQRRQLVGVRVRVGIRVRVRVRARVRVRVRATVSHSKYTCFLREPIAARHLVSVLKEVPMEQ